MVARKDEHNISEVSEEEEPVDQKLAMMKDPIVGVELVTYEEGKGSGARAFAENDVRDSATHP